MDLLYKQLFEQILWSKAGEDNKDRIIFLLEKYFFRRGQMEDQLLC